LLGNGLFRQGVGFFDPPVGPDVPDGDIALQEGLSDQVMAVTVHGVFFTAHNGSQAFGRDLKQTLDTASHD
jgi:hypothetical protein